MSILPSSKANTTQGSNTSPSPLILRGDGRYGFTARIDGDDLVVSGVRATWFGGAHDPLDNGQTASGLSTRLHPELLGCALPMNGFRVTRGSPLPDLPWMTTEVEVTRPSNGRRVVVPLIDLGPSAPPHAHAAIDLTVAAFRALGGELRAGEMTVDFRVRGAARRLPASILSAARAARREEGQPAPGPRAAIPADHHAMENAPRASAPAASAFGLFPLAAGAPGAGVVAASSGAASGSAGLAAPLARGSGGVDGVASAGWQVAGGITA